MDLNTRKEEFSYAHIQAIASVAGYVVEKKPRPMDSAGLDLMIECPGEIGTVLFPKIDAQVKCTASKNIVSEKYIRFPLPVRNYDILRHLGPTVPQILIVVLVPEKVEQWLNITREETTMRKCAYWMSLKGKESVPNESTITVHIPQTNLLTPDSLSQIMTNSRNF